MTYRKARLLCLRTRSSKTQIIRICALTETLKSRVVRVYNVACQNAFAHCSLYMETLLGWHISQNLGEASSLEHGRKRPQQSPGFRWSGLQWLLAVVLRLSASFAQIWERLSMGGLQTVVVDAVLQSFGQTRSSARYFDPCCTPYPRDGDCMRNQPLLRRAGRLAHSRIHDMGSVRSRSRTHTCGGSHNEGIRSRDQSSRKAVDHNITTQWMVSVLFRQVGVMALEQMAKGQALTINT
eukprot:scaffold2280_cov430-Prasinococcus_capsulatus_cf.AAC.26